MKRIYAGRYDVSALASGQYQIELGCVGERVVPKFTIDPPAQGHISMAPPFADPLHEVPPVRQNVFNN